MILNFLLISRKAMRKFSKFFLFLLLIYSLSPAFSQNKKELEKKPLPDLVVEIRSPSESVFDLESKLRDYFAAGTQTVWIVNPAERVVTVRSGSGTECVLGEGDALDGGLVLPGFVLPVARVFERLAAT